MASIEETNNINKQIIDITPQIVTKVPPLVHYIPNFITEEEEKYLMKQVYEAPKPKWTELLNRRLQNWGGVPHQKGMIKEPIPKWLQTMCDKVSMLKVFDGCEPNHILVNEYLSGQGIMPHTDGPMYHPVVANITLNSHGVLDLYQPIDESSDHPSTALDDRHFGSILLERRSLILVQKDMYSEYLHGIREVTTDVINEKFVNLNQCPEVKVGDERNRDTRVSLTIRNVPKVIKAKIQIGGFRRR